MLGQHDHGNGNAGNSVDDVDGLHVGGAADPGLEPGGEPGGGVHPEEQAGAQGPPHHHSVSSCEVKNLLAIYYQSMSHSILLALT